MPEEKTPTSHIYEIPIDQLESYDKQPRHHFDDESIENLKNNIIKNGIITPLLVTNEHKVLSGERRLRAAKAAGHETVPVIYKEDNIYEIAVLDNIMREDLTVVEKAEALKRLCDEQKNENIIKTNEEFGQKFSFKKSTITEYFNIANMKPKIKDLFRGEPDAAVRKLKEIALIKDLEKQLSEAKAYKESLKNKIRARATKPVAAAKKVDAFLEDIKKLEVDKNQFSGWDKKEKNDYIEKLEQLESQLQEFIQKIKGE